MSDVIEVSVSEPWFTYIKDGRKRIEGRLDKGKFSKLEAGDIVRFTNNNKSFMARISNVVRYPSFEEYLSQEGLKRTLPGVNTIREGVRVYHRYYTPEQEREHGIVAIYLKLMD